MCVTSKRRSWFQSVFFAYKTWSIFVSQEEDIFIYHFFRWRSQFEGTQINFLLSIQKPYRTRLDLKGQYPFTPPPLIVSNVHGVNLKCFLGQVTFIKLKKQKTITPPPTPPTPLYLFLPLPFVVPPPHVTIKHGSTTWIKFVARQKWCLLISIAQNHARDIKTLLHLSF